jgi:hypothetical protein
MVQWPKSNQSIRAKSLLQHEDRTKGIEAKGQRGKRKGWGPGAPLARDAANTLLTIPESASGVTGPYQDELGRWRGQEFELPVFGKGVTTDPQVGAPSIFQKP